MSCLVINCITDWTGDPGDSDFIGFDEIFGQFQDDVELGLAGLTLSGEVERVYVQFQYDCGRLPNAVAGTRVGRYSKRHKDIQAYVEVTRDGYQAVEGESGKLALMKEILLGVLREVGEKLEGKVEHTLLDLIRRVQLL